MKNIGIVIRAFSRVDDVDSLVHIIQTQWKTHNYKIFVSFNGASHGYALSHRVKEQTQVIEITENAGHKKGAAQLVQSALPYVTDNFDFVLFIEGDFWLLDEGILLKYIEKNCDVATTLWVESKQSLAVDFFLVKQSFLQGHKAMFDWGEHPEQDMAVYLNSVSAKVSLIEELRPTHVPSSMRKLIKLFNTGYLQEGGRFRIFPKAKAITHHAEDLEKKMATKQGIANALARKDIFPDVPEYTLNFFEKHFQLSAQYFPQSSWFKKHKFKNKGRS